MVIDCGGGGVGGGDGESGISEGSQLEYRAAEYTVPLPT